LRPQFRDHNSLSAGLSPAAHVGDAGRSSDIICHRGAVASEECDGGAPTLKLVITAFFALGRSSSLR
jgi:hypothetical protein